MTANFMIRKHKNIFKITIIFQQQRFLSMKNCLADLPFITPREIIGTLLPLPHKLRFNFSNLVLVISATDFRGKDDLSKLVFSIIKQAKLTVTWQRLWEIRREEGEFNELIKRQRGKVLELSVCSLHFYYISSHFVFYCRCFVKSFSALRLRSALVWLI